MSSLISIKQNLENAVERLEKVTQKQLDKKDTHKQALKEAEAFHDNLTLENQRLTHLVDDIRNDLDSLIQKVEQEIQSVEQDVQSVKQKIEESS